MIVPSRSRKTAGDNSLDGVVVIEAGDQLVARNCGRAEFADDHRAGVVRNLRRLSRGRFATKSQSKEGDGGVTRARDIEDLPRFGGNVPGVVPFRKASCPARLA